MERAKNAISNGFFSCDSVQLWTASVSKVWKKQEDDEM